MNFVKKIGKGKFTPLLNPKTDEYYQLKKLILGKTFNWQYRPASTYGDMGLFEKQTYKNVPFYSHCFLARPWDKRFAPSEEYENETRYPRVIDSDLMPLVSTVIEQIFQHNVLEIVTLLRVNANQVEPQREIAQTFPHVDHQFDHRNMLIYFTDAGGETILYDEDKQPHIHDPKEDDIVAFGGSTHHHVTPKDDRRVVLVLTYI